MDRHFPNFSQRFTIFFKPWRNQVGEIRRYWALYGGWRGFLSSPPVHLSIVFGVVLFFRASKKFDISSAAISIVPSLVGFTVGAFAIILAFSSSKLFVTLTEEGSETSLFMKTVANFVHFIVVQVAALLMSVINAAHPFALTKCTSSILLVYAVLTTWSTGIMLFQMATVFNTNEHKGASEGH